MLRLPATDRENYKGPFFFNFGGPGDAGTLTLPQVASRLREGALASAFSGYDLVSFDPRGVGNTLPAVSCFQTEEESLEFAQNLQNSAFGRSKESFIRRDAYYRLLDESCADNAAGLTPYIGTVFVAEDLKRMVEAYGFSDKLSFLYVGHSQSLF